MKPVIKIISFICLVSAALAVRAICVLGLGIIDGDCAVAGLMAKHISEFKEFPIYVPLLHYSGTLLAYIAALFFKFLGVSAAALGLAGMTFSILWALFTFILSGKLLDETGSILTLIFTAIPPFGLLYYSLFTAGIHAENMVFVPLILLLLVKWNEGDYKNEKPYLFVFGFISGVGLWLTPGVFPALVTAAIIFLIKDGKRFFRKSLPSLALGFLAGFAPAVVYNFQHPMATLFRMLGRIFGLDRSVLASPDMLKAVWNGAMWRVSTIPASLLNMPRLIISLVGIPGFIAFAASLLLIWKKKARGGISILLVFILIFTVFYCVLVGEDRPRYMVPLAAIIPIFIGRLFSGLKGASKIALGAIFCGLILFNVYDIQRSLLSREPAPYGELVEWLISNDIKSGYSDYNTSYAVTFESGEKILVSPTLFHKDFCDRYPEYTKIAADDARAVFIADKKSYPDAADMIESYIRGVGASYKKAEIGRFIVFYEMSLKVFPPLPTYAVGRG